MEGGTVNVVGGCPVSDSAFIIITSSCIEDFMSGVSGQKIRTQMTQRGTISSEEPMIMLSTAQVLFDNNVL